MLNARFHQALLRIGISEITRPVFYNTPQCLRFEIGSGHFSEKEYPTAALRRAETLLSALPCPPDILRIDFNTIEDSLETFLEKAKLPTPKEIIPGEEVLHLYWNLSATPIDIENLLREIIRSDFGGIWQLGSSVFFMDTRTATLFYLYDDRGADLAGADKNYLKRMYEKYDRWILDYDRDAMLNMLKETSP